MQTCVHDKQVGGTMTEPQELLGDLRTLRDRTRADRRGFAFPLLLFGGLILVAPVLYSPFTTVIQQGDGSYFIPAPTGPFPQFTPAPTNVEDPWLVGYYWVTVIVGGFAATAWWYRHRARRLGVEADLSVTLIAAGVALAGLLVGPDLLRLTLSADLGLYSAPWLNLPILFGAAALSAITFRWGSRPARPARSRSVAMAAGTLLAAVAFAALCVYFRSFTQLIVIAVGLLALAWWERSVLLGVVATLFTIASVPANHSLWYWDLPNLFSDLGWQTPYGPAGHDARVHAWQTLLIPGLLLVGGGVIALLTRHGTRR